MTDQSPHMQIAAVLSEPTFVADELHILARDAKGLKAGERDLIRRAADELDIAHRTIATIYERWQEQQRMLTAVSDRLIAANAAAAKAHRTIFPTLTLSLGPVPMQMRGITAK